MKIPPTQGGTWGFGKFGASFLTKNGRKIEKKIGKKDIEVYNDNFGKPSIKINRSVDNFLKKKIKNKKYKIYLSLSDDLPWAQATVIISYR